MICAIRYQGKDFAVVGAELPRIPHGVPISMEFIEQPAVVIAVPVLPTQDVLLVRHWRPILDRTLLECPVGKLIQGESPKAAIRRELSEEVGLYPQTLSLIGAFFTSVGTSTKRIYCFVAKDFEERTIRKEDRERMNIERFSTDALRQMLKTGIMADGKTEIALSRYIHTMV